ncbi:MAG: hypothetical protein MHM6MM_004125 [Cercozoa sp. M6MM]
MSQQPAKPSTGVNQRLTGTEKQRDVRTSNLLAAKAVADLARTSLGPRGMDKMITTDTGEVVLTNDGATILSKIKVSHPAAKMMIELSKTQDVEAGDGTTSVVVLTGALLGKCQELLGQGVHPGAVADAFTAACAKSIEVMRGMAIPVDLKDTEALVRSAITSLNSKVVSEHSATLAPIAVEAVRRLLKDDKAQTVDLRDIKVVSKLGGTVDDTELVEGLVFDQRATRAGGGPTRIENAKIGLIQFQLSSPKTNMENSVVINDYQQMDRILAEEKKYIVKMVKTIAKTGCNVLLIQKSILRDAVNDLSLHYLARKGIMVIRDIEREDIEFISKTLGCTPIASVDTFHKSKLGEARLVEEVHTSSGKIVKVTGVANPGRTVSVLVRGSNQYMLDEADRSMHVALFLCLSVSVSLSLCLSVSLYMCICVCPGRPVCHPFFGEGALLAAGWWRT